MLVGLHSLSSWLKDIDVSDGKEGTSLAVEYDGALSCVHKDLYVMAL